MENEKALFALGAAALTVGFVMGRKKNRQVAVAEYARTRDIAKIQHELLEFILDTSKRQNLTQKQFNEGLNERLDFLNIVTQM